MPESSNGAVSIMLSSTGDRQFESPFLQRGVSCEPDFQGRIPSMTVGDFARACGSSAMLASRSRSTSSTTTRTLGCMHSFLWAEMYPDLMDGIVGLLCAGAVDTDLWHRLPEA